MKKIITLLFAVATLVYSGEMGLKGGSCEMSQDGDVSVSFKAYKTPKKAAVGGVFDSVEYSAVASIGNNFREILVGSTVKIDTSSVNSKNKGRDETLVKFFFDKMSSKTIEAKIVDIKADKREKGKPKTGLLITEITMNGVTKTVPMNYSFHKGKLDAEGVIDIFDFSANEALASINKACYDLHEGKTWSDVAIAFSTNIKFDKCDSTKK